MNHDRVPHTHVLGAIHTVLRDHLRSRHLDAFSPQARLNEDLHLDSILLLEVFLELELSHGLSVPDTVIAAASLATVADLAALLGGSGAAPPPPPSSAEAAGGSVHGDEYTDIKVHCVVSCLCDAVKRRGLDHRPFYFAVWDADFAVGEDWVLRYHAEGISHDFFRHWFQRLYGAEVRQWYDHGRDKATNLAVLLDLVARRPPPLSVMAMVDLFHLPERENKFNQNPFPHYLMLEEGSTPDRFLVADPDFRWEGEIARDQVIAAFMQPSVAGGYLFDRDAVRPPTPEALAAYFDACFQPEANPLTAAVRAILAAHVEGRRTPAGRLTPAGLSLALREVPVIAIRKYAYEHGFAFFWRALGWPDDSFLARCDEIEALVQGFRAVHYAALRLAQTGQLGLADGIMSHLDRLDTLEYGLKRHLGAAFAAWRAESGAGEAGA